MKKSTFGFTVVELVLVMVVLGILTAVGSVMWSGLSGSSANNVRSTEVKQWASTFDLYKSRFGVFPVLPVNDATPIVACLGDFTATGGKCGNLSRPAQTYTVDPNIINAVKTVGKAPQNTAAQVNGNIVGPVAYVSQSTSGGTTTVTVVYIGFFQGNACPNGLLNVTSQQPARAILTGVSSTAACALQDNTFSYPAGSPPTPVPTPTPTPTPVPTPTPAPTPTPVPRTTPGASRTHSCVAYSGRAYCWGSNDYGQLGNGTKNASLVPIVVNGALSGKTVTVAVAGPGFSCAVASGKAYCWGANGFGMLGNGTTADSLTPTAVDASGVLSGKTVTDISLGHNWTCAIASGKAYCWGINGNGQLGKGGSYAGWSAYESKPVAVVTSGVLSGKTVTDISTSPGITTAGSGYATTCVVASGKAYCWGSDRQGQVGVGTYGTNYFSPVAVSTSGVLNGKTVTAISTGGGPSASGGGYNATCAVASGKAYCWGYNGSGQLGDGSTANSLVPVAVTASGVLNGKTVTDIGVGEVSSCAVASGKVYCWGNNAYGQLGTGNTTKSYVPVAVSTSGVLGGKTVSGITILHGMGTAGGGTGYGTTCVIANGRNYCWGYNRYGILGNGTTTNSSVPVGVRNL